MTAKKDTLKTNQSLPDLDHADIDAAKEAGALDAVREAAKAQFQATDGVAVTSDPVGITPTYDIFHLQDMLEMDPKALKAALEGKGDGAFVPSLGQTAGLLEAERSGKNRSDVVDTLCAHLGIKSPYEVTDAGPNYTNVVSRKLIA